MGAKIEYDMRAEIFSHYQKLSFRFYDDQKVGQLMSRITSDLFDITELLHHGPENIVISLIRIIGAFVIMINISPRLTVAAFALVPFMLVYAYVFNKKMKCAFRMNRVKIADILPTRKLKIRSSKRVMTDFWMQRKTVIDTWAATMPV